MKEVKPVKKTDKPVVIINGDNNIVNFGEYNTPNSVAVKALSFGIVIGLSIAVAILAISHCCPELLIEFVRLTINWAIGS